MHVASIYRVPLSPFLLELKSVRPYLYPSIEVVSYGHIVKHRGQFLVLVVPNLSFDHLFNLCLFFFFFNSLWVSCLSPFYYYNKLAQTGCLINNKFIFYNSRGLEVQGLGAGIFGVWRGPTSSERQLSFHCNVTWQKGKTSSLWSLFVKSTSVTREGSALLT